MGKTRRRWLSPPPKTCDLCDEHIDGQFVDGATEEGSWAFMCKSCHGSFGKGLGIGRGQLYERENDGIYYLKDGGRM